ncbi:MAG: hypothetical protein KatS3mg087_1033 [Patescibacteria group bacterium]|nr:MAG: hypothetical protein KatS3mg087_1033 [Patescibacteria group bacterium]
MAMMLPDGYIPAADVCHTLKLSRHRLRYLLRRQVITGLKLPGYMGWLIDARSIKNLYKKRGKVPNQLLRTLSRRLGKIENYDAHELRAPLSRKQIKWAEDRINDIFRIGGLEDDLKIELKEYVEGLHALGATPGQILQLVIEWLEENIDEEKLYRIFRWIPILIQLLMLIPLFGEKEELEEGDNECQKELGSNDATKS